VKHKDDSVYIEHMLECMDRIDEYTERDRERFFSSTLVRDAVVRNLQTLAESSQHLSSALKEAYRSVPWRDISGFRNILVHDYLGVDPEVIWSVIDLDLPGLRDALEQMKKQ
jgi:uncharacterized protein with HEPN domain